MRNYEIAMIFHPQTPADDIQALVTRITDGIARLGNGVVLKVDDWGLRRMAYKIRKQREGYYIFMYTEMPGNLVTEVERLLRLTENILRFLVIKDSVPPAESEAEEEANSSASGGEDEDIPSATDDDDYDDDDDDDDDYDDDYDDD